MKGERYKEIIHKIGSRCGFEVISFSSRYGGSINSVYLLHTTEGSKILKLNQALEYPGMFEVEKQGLQILRESKAIDVPEVFEAGIVDTTAFLLMEYKSEGARKPDFNTLFGKQLSDLHQISAERFGLENANYMGSLPQHNEWTKTAADFYIEQRLEPQFKLAYQYGFSLRKLDMAVKNIADAIPHEPPSLIHGDLWAGNFVVNEQGLPCLIDPAACYGPREMDLAMMKLFGGFPSEIFSAYEDCFPLPPGYQERTSLWQLYYLLVHLNLFGSGYLGSVNRILQEYT